jgi:hypothetical protein
MVGHLTPYRICTRHGYQTASSPYCACPRSELRFGGHDARGDITPLTERDYYILVARTWHGGQGMTRPGGVRVAEGRR